MSGEEDAALRLARAQLARDREQTQRFSGLFEHKVGRMLASPHALFRGSAALFYDILREHPGVPALCKRIGTIVGDMHLENVGAYRVDGKDAPVVFDLNDFDDAGQGPLSLDVLRLSTSLLLAGRTFGSAPHESLSLLDAGLSSYAQAMAAARPGRTGTTPDVVTALIARAQERSLRKLLDERAPRRGKSRRFVRGQRYRDVTREVADKASLLLEAWREALGARAPGRAYELVDVAQRIAGTGSLGGYRLALLVDAGEGDFRMIELKQQHPSSVHPWPGAGQKARAAERKDLAVSPAERVANAARTLVAKPPRRLVALPTVMLAGEPVSFIGRALSPQEDKLALDEVDATLIAFIFRKLALAHRRSMDGDALRMSDAELASMASVARELAGRYEAVALAYAQLSRA